MPGLGGLAPGAGGVLLLVAEAGLHPADALTGGLDRGRGHVAPGAGVVARLGRARADGQQALHALEVAAGAGEVRLGPRQLGPRLQDVLLARPGEAQAQLGPGQGPLGLRRLQGEARVDGVDAGDLLTGLDGGALVDGEVFEGAAHLGREQDLGGLDVAGGEDAAVLAVSTAGRGEKDGAQDDSS